METPDFSIYDPEIEFVDPSGVKVTGLRKYKAAFGLIHGFIQFVYCLEKSSITFRLCFDKARQNIRIHWNAEIVPREIFGKSHFFIDGISVHELSLESGNLTQHRIERLLMNDQPVMPREGVIARLRREHSVTVPSFIQNENAIVNFQLHNPLGHRTPSLLFALEAQEESLLS